MPKTKEEWLQEWAAQFLKSGYIPAIDTVWDAALNSIRNGQCICYSAGRGPDGYYYVIRNDCPVHAGKLN